MNTELSLRETLLNEIESYNEPCPPVEIWIDETGNIFWNPKNDDVDLVWIDQDRGGLDKYVDETHIADTSGSGYDCIQGSFVIWNNSDFENPYHVSDFTKQITTI